MKTLLVLWLVSVAADDVTTSEPGKNERPNIILFLVDDMGWQDTSLPFHSVKTPYNTVYHTPNMERLANQGVIFTQAYTASPVCTPSRVSIMTGQYPARNNITNWTLRNSVEEQETARGDYPLLSPSQWNVSGLQPDDVTLAGLLRENGYRTVHIGKAHFGALGTPGADPGNLGFDLNIAGHAAGAPGSYYGMDDFKRRPGEESHWDVPGLEAYHGTDTYLTEALTLEALKVMENLAGSREPFFLNMAHYAIHTPIQPDPNFVGHYQNLDPVEAAYASMIEGMDHSLGNILDKLQELDIADHTLIIFTSDDGALSAHTRGQTILGTGLNTHNLPLMSGKGSAYEGGSRIPLIMAWGNPDDRTHSESQSQSHSRSRHILNLEQGSQIHTPVISHDLFPTIIELTGSEIPEDLPVDGASLSDVIATGGNMQERALFWHYPHKWGPTGPGLDPFTSVRKGDWKLIYFYRDRSWELYDISEDITETRNVMNTNRVHAKQLAGLMIDWMREVDARLPVDRTSGEPVPFPHFE